MKCSILAIGNEVVSGDIVNTNAVTIANYLKEFGIQTISHIAVPDLEEPIVKAIKRSLKEADLVITTGGMGPTYDDITKQAAAKALNRKLVRDDYSVEILNLYFQKSGRDMPSGNLSQCFFPNGSQIIQNPNGTAPASITQTPKGTLIMLPGPPIEVKALLATEEFRDFFSQHKTEEIIETTLKFFGIGESHLEKLLADYMKEEKHIRLAPYAKTGEVHLKITAKGKTKKEAQKRTDALKKNIDALAGQYLYTEGNDTIEEVLLKILKKYHLTVATAESCTGGMIGAALTAIPGSSESYLGGVITYSNELKQSLCGVKETTLETYGAVSQATACEMAAGARRRLGADIAISVTGIAGPGGSSADKPVGLVYIGISSKDRTNAIRFHFMGTREKVRQLTVKNALHLAFMQAKNLGKEQSGN